MSHTLPMLDTTVHDRSLRGTCAITGTSGYVGSGIRSRLAGQGWTIRTLSRSRPSEKHFHSTHVHFELGGELAPQTLEGVDALVHAAYDFRATRWRDIQRVNVEGSRRLFAAAREAKVERIVLVSTIAAFPGARSLYGRAKLEIERAAIECGAAIIRPGLVWGAQGAAMFGALQHVVERLPIVPLLGPRELQLTLVHEDDLALLVERLLELWPAGSRKLLVAASRRTLTFEELLRSLAARTGRRRRFVRLPWTAPWLGLRALEAVGARPPFRSDNLVSFVSTDDHPFARATDSAGRYGVRFRPYALT
jgi:nucleoside-diphosphate-sugar epimerase